MERRKVDIGKSNEEMQDAATGSDGDEVKKE